jgi:hypothetical protein
MYGGLFGDLPAAKNDAKKNDGATPPDPTVDLSLSAAASSNSQQFSNPPVIAPDPIIANVSTAPKNVAVLKMVPRSSKIVPTAALRPRPPPQRKQPRANVAFSTEPKNEMKTVSAVETSGNDSGTEIVTSLSSIPPVTVRDHSAGAPPVTDPYDPMVPNDVLAYWDRQAAVAQQERWAQERAQLWRDQEVVRQQLEQERQSLLQQGNVQELVERGRGRGGLSNVPAWLVAQQKQQQAQREEAL